MWTAILNSNHYHFTAYGIPTLLVGIISVIVASIILYKNQFSIQSLALFILSLLLAIWLISYSWLYWSTTPQVALGWASLAYIAVPLIPAATYLFVITLGGIYPKRRWYFLLALIIGIFFAIKQVWFHALFDEVVVHWWGYYPIYTMALGIPFLIFFLVFQTISLLELWLIYRDTTPQTIEHEQVKLMLIAFIVAYFSGIDFIAKFGIGVYPAGYVPVLAYVFILLYITLKYKLVDITPSFAARQILSTMADPLIVCDIDGLIRVTNQALTNIFGYSSMELLGKPVNSLLVQGSGIHNLMRLIQRNEVTTNDEILLKAKSGESILTSISYSSLTKTDDSANEGWVIIARDIRERKRIESQLSYLADHDHLTGLYNRRSLEIELKNHISYANSTRTISALLWLDLDHFKAINDSFGHNVGDQLLLNEVRIIRSQLRKSDLVARLGGDEFAIILPNVSQESADKIANNIVNAVSNASVQLNGHAITVTLSIGIVMFPTLDNVAENLLTYADIAMYKAKQNGRNTYCFYSFDTEWQPQFQTQVTWSARIKNALIANQLLLYCQPIVDLTNNTTQFYEVLLRMRDEANNIIEPGVFLEVAERYDLMRDINYWVLEHVLMTLSKHSHLQLTCNISGNALTDAKLFSLIESYIKSEKVDPRRLIIEITETAVMTDREHAIKFITNCKELGLKFALDDFGTGMSSFTHLKYFNVDYLKIDGSFVKNITQDKLDRELVRSTIDIAKTLGLKTIAEYIENVDIEDILKSLGANYGQGYYYGKPIPLENVL